MTALSKHSAKGALIVWSTVAPEIQGAHHAGPNTTQALQRESLPMSVTQ